MQCGRAVGVSIDTHDDKHYVWQCKLVSKHIRREKATSNICTAQALLANMASFYAVYTVQKAYVLAARRHHMTAILAAGLTKARFLTNKQQLLRYHLA
ncbi:hypothetical protein OH492_27475 [Vibrio chagasii]|nr:hypothetical protein [Vibrio chagasii]